MQDRFDIPGSSDDARAVRTRDALAWALVGLMSEQSYDDVSVQDICARAGIGRSTFYAHFSDKDELFIRHIVVFGETMGARLQWNPRRNGYEFGFRFMLEHLREMRPVYDSLARSRKIELITKVWINNLAEGFERTIVATRMDESHPLPTALLARHIATTAMNLLVWWLDRHYPLDSLDMEEHFHRLIAGLR